MDGFKKLLIDMNNKAENYSMLSSTDHACSLIRNSKFRFFYRLFNYIDYKHPRLLSFRALNDYKAGLLTKGDAIDIVVEVIKYMILFVNVMGHHSKNIITLFSDILDEVI